MNIFDDDDSIFMTVYYIFCYGLLIFLGLLPIVIIPYLCFIVYGIVKIRPKYTNEGDNGGFWETTWSLIKFLCTGTLRLVPSAVIILFLVFIVFITGAKGYPLNNPLTYGIAFIMIAGLFCSVMAYKIFCGKLSYIICRTTLAQDFENAVCGNY